MGGVGDSNSIFVLWSGGSECRRVGLLLAPTFRSAPQRDLAVSSRENLVLSQIQKEPGVSSKTSLHLFLLFHSHYRPGPRSSSQSPSVRSSSLSSPWTSSSLVLSPCPVHSDEFPGGNSPSSSLRRSSEGRKGQRTRASPVTLTTSVVEVFLRNPRRKGPLVRLHPFYVSLVVPLTSGSRPRREDLTGRCGG